MQTVLTYLDILFTLVGVYLVKLLLSRRPNLPLPPGPKGLPIIGNVFDMPQGKEWLAYTKWGHEYGDIMSLNLFGQTVVLLNSPKLAIEMLDKKSAIYSDRPKMEFGGELAGWRNTLVLTRYGERFREYRRFMHQLIGGRKQIQRFIPLAEAESRSFLRRVLKDPDAVQAHIRHTAGAIILQMSHGYKVEENDDPYVHLAEVAVDQFSLSTRPGAYLVDVFPILHYVPTWFPGAGFKKTAAAWHRTLDEMVDIPFDMVKRRMADHTNTPNYTSELLEKEQLVGDKEFNIKWSAVSLYGGGADTTVSANYSFFLAMTLYPDAQRKAQEEIDRVIGTDRLPTYADREHLPYVEALVTEVLRWNPVAPLGVPHRLIEDDMHAGYFIPKGSLVISNIWGFMHDPTVYEDPFTFDPSRFIPKDGKASPPNARIYCFGFGRRICPGLHLADATTWLTCALSLAALRVSKATENGKTIEPVVEYTDGTISHPKPFKCSINPRSAKAEALILSYGPGN